MKWWWCVALVVAGCGESGKAPVDASIGDDVPCVATLAAVPGSASFGPVTVASTSAGTTFAISNTGTCASSPVAVSLAGAAAASFQIAATSCAGRSLAPAESCTVTVSFRPQSFGPLGATLHIDGGATPLSVALDGTGVGTDPLTIFPGSRTFTATHVGETSAPLGFAVTNTGAATGGVANVTFTGNTGDFAVTADGCSGTALAPSQICTVELAFRPTSSGSKSITLQYFATGLGTIGGTATGSALPGLALAPAMHDFGARLVMTTSAAQRFTLTNQTTVSSSASLGVTLTGTDSSQFSIAADGCSAAVLAASATCDVDVVFQPTTFGARSAMLHVVDAKLGTIDVALVGTGLVAAPPMLAISPTSNDFGSVTVGSTSGTATFMVTNTGNAPTSAVTAAVSGPFEIVSDGCTGAPLAAAASCAVVARFTPTTIGAAAGMLTATATTGGQASAMLSGTALSGPHLIMSPTFLTFPATTVGSASSAMTVTVSWTGAQTTGALQTSLTGSAAGDYHIDADTCTGATLGAGGQCRIDISFRPTITGTRNALVEATATPGGTVISGLSGVGQ